MTKATTNTASSPKKRRKAPPGRTMEERQNQLIGYAVDLAEEKLLNGTASSQIISLLLNLATSKAQLELEKLRSDVEVANARVKMMEDQKTSKDLYDKALKAFASYSGVQVEDDWEDDDE